MSLPTAAQRTRSLFQSTLRRNLMAFFGILFVASILVLGIGFSFFVSTSEFGFWEQRQRETAQHAGQSVANLLQKTEHTLYLLDALGQAELVNTPELLNRALALNPSLNEIVYLNAAGQVTASTYRDHPLLANFFTVPQSRWFQMARAGNRYQSSLQFSTNDEPYVVIAMPGTNGAVIAARLKMDVLWDVVNDLPIGESGNVYIVNRDGALITHSRVKIFQQPQDIRNQSEFAAMIAPPADAWYGSVTTLDGKAALAASYRVPNTEWIIVVEVTRQEIFFASQRLLIGLVGSLFIFSFILITVVRNTLMRVLFTPLEHLRVGAEKIGQGDLAHQIPVTTHDEMGQVTHTFNQMALHLKEREAQLAAQHQALVRNEAQLLRITENMNDVITEINAEGNICYASPSHLWVLGMPPALVIGKPIWERVHPDDATDAVMALSAVLNDPLASRAVTFRYQHANGNYLWMECIGNIITDEQGIITALVLSSRDVTTRKQMETALRESEATLNRAQAVAHVGSWRNQMATNELTWSAETYRMFGIPADTPMNYDRFMETVHPADRAPLGQAWLAAVDDHTPFDFEHRIVVGNTMRWVRERAEIEYSADGTPLNGIGTVQDITERHNAEQALRESEQRYRLLAENVTDVIWTRDLSLNLTYISPSVQQLRGIPTEQALAQTIDQIMTPESVQHSIALFGEIFALIDQMTPEQIKLEAQRQSRTIELEFYCADGSTIWTESTINLLTDEHGQPTGFLGVTRDISERKHAEAQLRQLNDQLEVRVRERTAELAAANAKLERGIVERQRLVDRQTVLYETLRAVSRHLDIDHVCQAAAETIAALTGWAYVCIVLPEETRREWQVRGAGGRLTHHQTLAFPIDCGVTGRAFRTGETQIVPNVRRDPDYVLGATGTIQSEVAVPFQRGNQWLGTLNVESEQLDAFDADDVALIHLLGEAVALGIDNAHLYQAAQQEIAERKQVEQALRENEEKYRLHFENVNDVIYSLDTELRIVTISPSVEKSLGYLPDELVGKSIGEITFLEPAYFEQAIRDTILVFEGKQATSEYAFIAKDGTRKVAEITGSPIYSDGEIIGLVSVARDITERKRAEAEVLTHKTRLQHLLTASPTVIYSSEAHGNYAATFVSENVTAQLGYAPSDFTNTPGFWFQHIHPDDRERILAGLAPLFEVDEHTHEYRFALPDGTYHWMRDSLHLVRAPDGTPLEIVGSWTDITETKRMENELRESETRFRSVFDRASVGIALVDTQGFVLDANEADCVFLGYSKEELIGMHFAKFTHPDDLAIDNLQFQKLIRGEIDRYEIDKRYIRKDGQVVIGRLSVSLIRDVAGNIRYTLVICADVTSQKQMENALRESEERYALAARGANDGLFDWDLDTDYVYYSPRWKEMLGCAEHEIGNDEAEWFKRIHPADLPQLQTELTNHLRGNSQHFASEYRILHADGRYRWMLCRGLAVRDEQQRAYRFAGSQTDITRRKTAEERLLHDALHEPLTGLPNRVLFKDRVAQTLRITQRDPSNLSAVLFLDLDRFKTINDSLGHHIGDLVLVEAARRLEGCVRPGDTVARFGGDEFAILLNNLKNPNDAVNAAERVQKDLGMPFQIDGHPLSLSTSIGITLITAQTGRPLLYVKPEEVIRDADTAMYRAKALGKARHIVFDESWHSHAVELLHIEADLRHAIEHEQLLLYYQPVLTAHNNVITSVEALLRWQHPTRGLVPPSEFIPVAEESGIILPMGKWVLQTACRQIAEWRANGFPHLRVAVNFSARQFQDPALIAWISQTLQEQHLPGDALQIEITESTAMRDMEQSTRILSELDQMGVEISIDDFGNSYSALGYLKRFPFDILKIDQGFLRDITHDVNNAAITTAIIAMARALKLRVIAEGVETSEQLEFLRSRHCDEIQGYYFSRPIPAEAMTQLLRVPLVPAQEKLEPIKTARRSN